VTSGNGRPLFAFGTLMDPDVLGIVLGAGAAAWRTMPARVHDRARRWVVDDHYPVLVESPGVHVDGLLIHGLAETALDRIRFFEGEEFALAPIVVRDTDDDEIDARYFADTGRKDIADIAWSLADWQTSTKSDTLPRVHRYMACYGTMSIAEADAFW